MTIESRDSTGHRYRVDSAVEPGPRGGTQIRSWDSEGNDYRVESWTDGRGVHSRDSEGNTCTIIHSGTIIGCD